MTFSMSKSNLMDFSIGGDSGGNDLGNVQVNSVPAILTQIYKRSNPFDVIGFNTNGWIKNKIVLPLSPFPSEPGLFEGSYVRDDCI